MSNAEPIIKRIRRKVEIILLDRKARGEVVYHDLNEILSLLDMLEREINK